MGCLPPKPSAAFVHPREDVLAVYRRPYAPKRPVIRLDETFTQPIGASEPLRTGTYSKTLTFTLSTTAP